MSITLSEQTIAEHAKALIKAGKYKSKYHAINKAISTLVVNDKDWQEGMYNVVYYDINTVNELML